MIFQSDIHKLIFALEEAGEKVAPTTHAIYAGDETKFFAGLYPLEIIITKTMPKETACIVTRKKGSV